MNNSIALYSIYELRLDALISAGIVRGDLCCFLDDPTVVDECCSDSLWGA